MVQPPDAPVRAGRNRFDGGDGFSQDLGSALGLLRLNQEAPALKHLVIVAAFHGHERGRCESVSPAVVKRLAAYGDFRDARARRTARVEGKAEPRDLRESSGLRVFAAAAYAVLQRRANNGACDL